MRFGKAHDIRDDGSCRRFYPFNDFENGAAFRHRAKNVRMSFWALQPFVFVFVTNNYCERSCNNEFFPRSRVYKKKLKTILIPSDIRLFKPNTEGQRKIIEVAFRTADYSESKKNGQ